MTTSLSRKTILVVEDDQAILDVLCDALRDEGYIVLSAESGEQALDILRSVTPDLISLDYHLPGIQGVQLIAAFRKTGAAASPILLVTALLRIPRDLREAAQTVVKKPFNIAHLFDTIASLLAAQSEGPDAPQ